MTLRKVAMVCLTACLALTIGVAARAADYPTHAIKLIVPTAPGGINDIVARLIQPGLMAALKQPIVIENKTGANNIIGTDFVAKSAPDGYTLVVVPASHSVNPAVHAKMPFNTEKDLTPIILVGKNAMLFLVNPKVPAKTLREFAALAKASPDWRASRTSLSRNGTTWPASRRPTFPTAVARRPLWQRSPARRSSL
jgi:tripartite-type tricarboxylate transporter receptor subunit TctC